jgi:hypothetical protein
LNLPVYFLNDFGLYIAQWDKKTNKYE